MIVFCGCKDLWYRERNCICSGLPSNPPNVVNRWLVNTDLSFNNMLLWCIFLIILIFYINWPTILAEQSPLNFTSADEDCNRQIAHLSHLQSLLQLCSGLTEKGVKAVHKQLNLPFKSIWTFIMGRHDFSRTDLPVSTAFGTPRFKECNDGSEQIQIWTIIKKKLYDLIQSCKTPMTFKPSDVIK